eukprot:TRINITY_DN13529_c0_g1_i2.p1 TRINITY_DN13529_c0_g1~~TRINITY_DN13529_c0_g1_i2.p1  ORF type:complete len:197 (-),score=37.91 TRINITY_DN13529_c0_g1_i2:181-771(-)
MLGAPARSLWRARGPLTRLYSSSQHPGSGLVEMALSRGDAALESWWVLGRLYHLVHKDASCVAIETVALPLPEQPHDANFWTRHSVDDELFCVTKGTMSLAVNDQPAIKYGPGSYLWQPRGTKHAIWPGSEEHLVYINVISPPGLENLFRAIGTDADIPLGILPSEAVMPTDENMEALFRLAPEYGIELFPPSSED